MLDAAKEVVVEIATDLVALWESPVIQGLSRAERNEAIDGTRRMLIDAVNQLALSSTGSERGNSTPDVAGSSPAAPAKATVAQAAERPICKGKATGSTPVGGTIYNALRNSIIEQCARLVDECAVNGRGNFNLLSLAAKMRSMKER